MKQFFINLVGSIVLFFIFIYEFIFGKEIRKLDNPDPTNMYDPEDL